MAFSGSQTTRHGLYGGARQPYGSFAGKSEASVAFSTAPVVALCHVNPVVGTGTVNPTTGIGYVNPTVSITEP